MGWYDSPLADDERRSRVLALLHHVQEILLLCLPQRLKLLNCVDVNLDLQNSASGITVHELQMKLMKSLNSTELGKHLVFGLGLGWLKGAGQDCNLGIFNPLGHLWMAHVLVNYNAIHELCVLQPAAHFSIHLDQHYSTTLLGMSAICLRGLIRSFRGA